MLLLDLPLELFQLILRYAIQRRGIKRGLKLRLVNTNFDKEVIQVLFIFRLLDTHFSATGSHETLPLPSFTASYLQHRVLNEAGNGLPNLILIRRVSERLCQECDESTDGEQFQTYVQKLCLAHVENTKPFDFAKIFGSKAADESNFENHVFVAAVYTQATPIIKKWIAEGTKLYLNSWLFGSASAHAIKRRNHELLTHAMLDPPYGLVYSRRIHLVRKAAMEGSLELTRFIFNFEIDKSPWHFSNNKSDKLGYRAYEILEHMVTPDKGVWEFILGLRKTYLDEREYGKEKYTLFLEKSLELGWANMAAYLPALGAQVNGTRPHDTCRRPIISASLRGYKDVVKVLLANGAATAGAVEAASQRGHMPIVELLLEHGADTSGALEKAIEGGYRDIVELLINHDADLNQGTLASLPRVIELEHVPLFRLLMDRGTILDQRTMADCVRRAEEQGLDSMLKLLNENKLYVSA